MTVNNPPRARIAIAGFQHETNCFGATKAGLAEFEMADSWPEMLWGDRVITQTRGMNLPIAGFAEAAVGAGLELAPILWCAAEPSAQVTDLAFDTISSLILDGLRSCMPVDGVFLDLHGAMVTDTYCDGEGELLSRVRAIIGPDVPLIASLDLHANISPQMVENADFLAIFRSYPHLDMAETGMRCVPVMQQLLQGVQLHKAFRQVPYLIPLHAQFTGAPPFQGLYSRLPELEENGVLADIALGFTGADFPATGPACVAYGNTQKQADDTANKILYHFLSMEPDIDSAMLTLDQAVAVARTPRRKPVILADVQDNPGAGAASDTTGLLTALAQGGCTHVLMGLFHDPQVAELAHRAGAGGRFIADLGGKSGLPGQAPVSLAFEVLTLSDGKCRYTGEMYMGGTATLGPSAALKLIDPTAEIHLIVTSIRNQCLDLAHFTHFGLDPVSYATICVKSTVHYRAAFDPIATDCLAVAAPGAFLCDLAELPYRNLAPGKRVGVRDTGFRPLTCSDSHSPGNSFAG